MWEDPIVKEVREAREAYAAQFNYDLEQIAQDIKRQEQASGRTFVRFSPRPARPLQTTARKASRTDSDGPEVVSTAVQVKEDKG